jgi:SAM-dependent methyltransferase
MNLIMGILREAVHGPRVQFASSLRAIRNSFRTAANLKKNAGKLTRSLEIGPGQDRVPGFETLSVEGGAQVDYVWDASKGLPFETGTFETVYASHVLEHIPWYLTERTLLDWVRVLKRSGRLELWVPDGLKICAALLDAECGRENRIDLDGWYKFNPTKDPCVWAAGRLFTYGDGHGNPSHPNWHRALFTPRYLRLLLERTALTEITEMDPAQVRGHDHGWINLGMTGRKP